MTNNKRVCQMIGMGRILNSGFGWFVDCSVLMNRMDPTRIQKLNAHTIFTRDVMQWIVGA